jgi:hypothetical protein
VKISPEILAELADFQTWRNANTDFDLWSYVCAAGTPDLFFAFMALMHDGDFSHRGKPISPAWLHDFAHSIPTAGEGLCMASCWELSRRYLVGEDLLA